MRITVCVGAFLLATVCTSSVTGSDNVRTIPAMVDLIQWPAMGVTVVAAWFVASRSRERRRIGFWLFLLSNVLWVVWGVHTRAYALVILQVCLAFMNIRGERRAKSHVA